MFLHQPFLMIRAEICTFEGIQGNDQIENKMKKVFFLTVVLTFSVSFLHFTEIASAKKWTVNVSNNVFTPSNLTHVTAGDTIQWVWVEGTHTTTSVSIPSGAMDWDSPITQDEPTFLYRPLVNGTYTYQCTPHASTMTGRFLVTGGSGIAPGIDPSQVTIFPNPFTDRMTIQAEVNKRSVKTVNIFTIKGELVRQFNYLNESFPGTIIVEMNELSTGVYMIELVDNSNNTLVRRVIRY